MRQMPTMRVQTRSTTAFCYRALHASEAFDYSIFTDDLKWSSNYFSHQKFGSYSLNCEGCSELTRLLVFKSDSLLGFVNLLSVEESGLAAEMSGGVLPSLIDHGYGIVLLETGLNFAFNRLERVVVRCNVKPTNNRMKRLLTWRGFTAKGNDHSTRERWSISKARFDEKHSSDLFQRRCALRCCGGCA